MKVGIVGLPNVGKSTLFNALLKKRVALSANYPFATVEPNVGVVAVPDGRLQVLSELVQREESKENPPPIVPAVVEFVDIAGLVKGASTGAGLGNQFLSHIREVDAIVHVLRDFEDASIIREGSENPDSDKLTVETELGLADLQVIDKLIDNLKKEAKPVPNLRNSEKMVPILEEIKRNLEQGEVTSKLELEDRDLKKWFETLPLLTIKPVLYVYNVDEARLQAFGSEAQARRVTGDSGQENSLTICAKLEEELADLDEAERLEYLKSVGVEQTGLERLIKKAYSLLGLISFLTAGVKEVRAWTIKKGTLAPQAAGVIHTDFERKFIRAQVIEYEKLIEAGSYGLAKQKGWIRTEGKDYEVEDGDVVEFLVGS
ncbi:redox-regulated ATPase YchF [Candidatus Daviesbacteria bacterium]|nr:redox-regulated ATPase YchF [Candidatus Daviesbacteria bacterium]